MTRPPRTREEHRAAESAAQAAKRQKLIDAIFGNNLMDEPTAELFVDLASYGELALDARVAPQLQTLVARKFVETRSPAPSDPSWIVRAAPTEHGRRMLFFFEEAVHRPRRDKARRHAPRPRVVTPAYIDAMVAYGRRVMEHLPWRPEYRVFYCVLGRRFARVFGAMSQRDADERLGNIVCFVEIGTGRVFGYRNARQVGEFSGRVIEIPLDATERGTR